MAWPGRCVCGELVLRHIPAHRYERRILRGQWRSAKCGALGGSLAVSNTQHCCSQLPSECTGAAVAAAEPAVHAGRRAVLLAGAADVCQPVPLAERATVSAELPSAASVVLRAIRQRAVGTVAVGQLAVLYGVPVSSSIVSDGIYPSKAVRMA